MAEKKKTYISPKGKAKWPWLRKADIKYVKDDDNGKFSVALVLDPATVECEEFLALINSWSEAVEGDGVPYKEVDGAILVRFASFYPPSVFDAHRNVIPPEVEVGSGSEIKVAFQPNYYKGFGGGINLYMKAVQVIDLVAYTGASAEDVGFDEEDGYAPEKAEVPFDNPDKPEEDEDGSTLPF